MPENTIPENVYFERDNIYLLAPSSVKNFFGLDTFRVRGLRGNVVPEMLGKTHHA
jgi:hypothetical protein